MNTVLQSWQILVAALAGWMGRQQDAVIELPRARIAAVFLDQERLVSGRHSSGAPLRWVAVAALISLAGMTACNDADDPFFSSGDSADSLSGRWSFQGLNGDDVHLVSCAAGLERLEGLTYTEALTSHPQHFTFEDLRVDHEVDDLYFFVESDAGGGIGVASSVGSGTVSGDTIVGHVYIINYEAQTRTLHRFSGTILWPDTVHLAQATFFVNGVGGCDFAPPLLLEVRVGL